MKIFLLLNGMGVIFLLYTLAMFWIEGHRPKSDARMDTAGIGSRDWADVLVVTHPISHSAQGGLSVIPFRVRDRNVGKPALGGRSPRALESPVKQISTR